MTPEARERLARIAIVKPEKARSIEEFIIKGARTVRARGRRRSPAAPRARVGVRGRPRGTHPLTCRAAERAVDRGKSGRR